MDIEDQRCGSQSCFSLVMIVTTRWLVVEKPALLFSLPDSFNAELEVFLARENRPELSWVHEVRLHQFARAHVALQLASSNPASDMTSKKILTSLSKLAAYAAEISKSLNTSTCCDPLILFLFFVLLFFPCWLVRHH